MSTVSERIARLKMFRRCCDLLCAPMACAHLNDRENNLQRRQAMIIPEGSDNALHPACRSILIRMLFGFRALLRTF